jgi:hypothetical protein
MHPIPPLPAEGSAAIDINATVNPNLLSTVNSHGPDTIAKLAESGVGSERGLEIQI